MRTLTTYLDDDDGALVVSWTRPNDGGAFVSMTYEGTTVETLYSVPWRVLRDFALELLSVLDDEDGDGPECGTPVPCRAAVLRHGDACAFHGPPVVVSGPAVR